MAAFLCLSYFANVLLSVYSTQLTMHHILGYALFCCLYYLASILQITQIDKPL